MFKGWREEKISQNLEQEAASSLERKMVKSQ